MKYKSKYCAFFLALFLGGIGAHKFYLKKYVMAAIYLIFFWTFIPFCLSIIDAIILLFTTKEKFDNKYNTNSTIDSTQKDKYKNSVISTSCFCNGKEYFIKGKRNRFVVKDKTHEFLIKDGQIVACKNKNISKEFIKYSGDV